MAGGQRSGWLDEYRGMATQDPWELDGYGALCALIAAGAGLDESAPMAGAEGRPGKRQRRENKTG